MPHLHKSRSGLMAPSFRCSDSRLGLVVTRVFATAWAHSSRHAFCHTVNTRYTRYPYFLMYELHVCMYVCMCTTNVVMCCIYFSNEYRVAILVNGSGRANLEAALLNLNMYIHTYIHTYIYIYIQT